MLVVALWSAPDVWRGLAWGALAASLVSILPFLFVVRGVRRNQFTDHHVGERRQRTLPLLVALGSASTGLGLLAVGGAPRALLVVVATMISGLMIAIPLTLVWKVSLHTLTLTAAVVLLGSVSGLAAACLSVLVVLVGWSRVELRAHSPAQVVAGAALGAGVAAAVCLAF